MKSHYVTCNAYCAQQPGSPTCSSAAAPKGNSCTAEEALEETETKLEKLMDEMEGQGTWGSLVELRANGTAATKGPAAFIVAKVTALSTGLLLLHTTILQTMLGNHMSAGMIGAVNAHAMTSVSTPAWMGGAVQTIASEATVGLANAINAGLHGMAHTIAGPIIFGGLITYVIFAAYTCTLLAGILPWAWGKCFLKGLALPFMMVGNLFECFGALIEAAIRRSAFTSYFRCYPLPIFDGFWDYKFGTTREWLGLDSTEEASLLLTNSSLAYP